MTSKSNLLLPLVESFFRDYLVKVRGVSPHTVKAYRDALQLFFVFIADRRKRAVAALAPEDLQVDAVSAFLDHLEGPRANTAVSRNHRLAALRTFFKHLVRQDLPRAGQYERILALESKKTRTAPATYLESPDVRLILKQPDLRTAGGARDHALLLFLFNTGARVSEAIGVRQKDLSLHRPQQVRLHGKGKKDRFCPLWRETVQTLRSLPAVRDAHPGDLLFRNARGHCLTRDGVAYILRKHAQAAARQAPALRHRRITPHTLRHSCAMALLQGGVDLTVIRDYLGHASIATTSRYVMANLKMKREALDVFWRRSGLSPKRATWKPAPDLLAFLSSL
jgi:integrase/recombinase XerD